MKKRVLSGILIILLIFSLSFAIAATNATDVDKAYKCLEGKVKDKCASLSSPEERIFSLLAIGQCKDTVLSDVTSYMSDTQFTAQAILALTKANTNTADADAWLISQNKTTDTINWFLQIVSNENVTTCTITSSSSSADVTVGATLSSSNLGSCFSLPYTENYNLLINPSCYNQEFNIFCVASFSTDLLYKKTTDPPNKFYVSANTHSAAAAGTTKEKVNSFCFTKSGVCDYEASLWAALVLKFKGVDISPYLPYLVTMADEVDNKEYIPESFLYSLTNTLRSELLAKQLPEGYWDESGDKYYDTALALLPFQSEEIAEKTKSKNWLQTLQGTDGCWDNGNIRNTAFILYSLWPKKITTEVGEDDCVSSGFFCMSDMSCTDAGGEVLSDYSGCFGTSKCCSKEQQVQTCSEQGGELCSSEQQCLEGNTVEASDSSSEKFCCVEGTCGISEVSECETNNGFCKMSCSDQEQSASYSCTSSSDVCCVAKKSSSLVWIILILVVLIILVTLGIIFRKQLREFFLKLKSQIKFGKGKGPAATTPGGPRFPPTSSARTYPGAVQRKVITTTTQRVPVRAPVRKPAGKSDFDDILKKLKEIGK